MYTYGADSSPLYPFRAMTGVLLTDLLPAISIENRFKVRYKININIIKIIDSK